MLGEEGHRASVGEGARRSEPLTAETVAAALRSSDSLQLQAGVTDSAHSSFLFAEVALGGLCRLPALDASRSVPRCNWLGPKGRWRHRHKLVRYHRELWDASASFALFAAVVVEALC